MSGPYATSAHAYRRAGWAPLPLPERAKAPVPEGWTGRAGAWPSGADVQAWTETNGVGNVGLRFPPTVLGIDVDAYGAKRGAETLAMLVADLGPLPGTWRSTSREDEWSGIYPFLVPAARRWPGVLGPGIEVVRFEHRYAVVWPSVHPDTGATYRWLTPDGVVSLTPPSATDLPYLPQPWLARFGSESLTDMPSAGMAERVALEWLEGHGGGRACAVVAQAAERSRREVLYGGSRHEAALLGANRLVWLASEGHPGVAGELRSLRAGFLRAVQGDRPADVAQGEWGRLLVGAVNLAAAAHPTVGGDPCRFQDLVPSALLPDSPAGGPLSLLPSAPPSPQPDTSVAPMPTESPQETAGATTSLEVAQPHAEGSEAVYDPLEAAWRASMAERFPPTDWTALWADETVEEWWHEPLLGAGRSVVIYSPPKVGKSLLTLELVVALANATPWLGSQAPRPLRVLLLDFENHPRDDLRARLIAMGYEPDDLTNVVLLSFPTMAPLDTIRGAEELITLVDYYHADLVVIDTVSRIIQGEENSNDTWLNIYRLAGLPLKARGVAVLRLDHTGKDEAKGMRGGSAKYGDVDAVWRLSTIVPDLRFRLECTQSRMAVPAKVLDIQRRADPLGHALTNSLALSPLEERINIIIGLCDAAELPNDAGRGDVTRVAKAHGYGARTETMALVVARRKARGTGVGMSEMPVPSGVGQAHAGGLSQRDGTAMGQESQNPRSALTQPPMGQHETGTSAPLSHPLDPYGVGSRGQGGSGDETSEGWWANVAGSRKWIDKATGSVHDAPP